MMGEGSVRSTECLLDLMRKGQLPALPGWKQEIGVAIKAGDLTPVTHFLQ